jgi:hypothetical protein
MGASLREFLKEKAEEIASDQSKNNQLIAEWQVAVNRLIETAEKWLIAADPNGLIRRERKSIEINEPRFGRYGTKSLNLECLGKWVGVIPKARKTVKRAAPQQDGAPEKATGRVDITDEIRRYVLYRFGEGPDEERWFIEDSATNAPMQPLTEERFESALLSYFQ